MALTQVSKDVLNSTQANITQVGTLANLTVSGNLSVNENIITNGAVIGNSLTVGGAPSATLYNPGFLYFDENPPDSGFYNATFDGYALEVAQIESIIVGDVITMNFAEGSFTLTVTGVWFEEESQKYLYFNDPVPLGTSPAGEFVSMEIAAQPPILEANSSTVAVSGNISTSSNIKFTNWAMYETCDTLYFTHNGVIKMSINSDGNLTVTGDVAGFGTP